MAAEDATLERPRQRSERRHAINYKSAQQRTQLLTIFSASADHAAARYDFRFPPSSLSQTNRYFFKSTTSGSSLSRTGDRFPRAERKRPRLYQSAARRRIWSSCLSITTQKPLSNSCLSVCTTLSSFACRLGEAGTFRLILQVDVVNTSSDTFGYFLSLPRITNLHGWPCSFTCIAKCLPAGSCSPLSRMNDRALPRKKLIEPSRPFHREPPRAHNDR